MSTRREFVQTAALGAFANAVSMGSASAAEKGTPILNSAGASSNELAHSAHPIRSATARDETLRRFGGSGMFPCLTWDANDQQLLTVVEGGGWADLPKDLYVEGALAAIKGPPESAAVKALPGYPYYDIRQCHRPNGRPVYSVSSALAVDRRLYVFCNTFGDAWKITDETYLEDPNRGHKLIYSPDNGRTWCNQNGSSPVVWERAPDQSKQTMAFWKEPGDAFQGLSFLQMGRDYGDNRDGYVYAYGSNGTLGDPDLNELGLFRVPKAKLLDRGSYEYFAGTDAKGEPRWAKDIRARAAVYAFPPGDSKGGAWQFGGVVYNAALGTYMMTAFQGGLVEFLKILELELPKNVLGLWTAPNPWGPWSQAAKIDPWFPGGDANAHVISVTVAPKWISPDGKSLWIVWSDIQHSSDYRPDIVAKWFYAPTDEEATRFTVMYRGYHPHLCINAQRIDLQV